MYSSFSLLPALCSSGIIYSEVCKGAYDRASFVAFIKALMLHMNPLPVPHSILPWVMDNCSIHHIPEVRTICEAR
ncbi:hypothetical protein K439DRAFT_1337005 [Ramaria rubella]|nr:hypothetical protein K439DRAFT_1337005 [Ramaria rubella]